MSFPAPEPQTPASSGRGGWPLAAVALTTVLTAESMRVLITLLYNLREESGTLPAVGAALAVFVVPFVAALVRWILRPATSVPVLMVLLALLMAAVQLLDPIPLILVAVATAVGLIALTLQLHAFRSPTPAGGKWFAVGLIGGLALDTAMDALFTTWSPAWQAGIVPDVVTGVVCLALIACALRSAQLHRVSAPGGESSFGTTWPVLALGPFLMVQLVFLANIGFLDANGRVGIAVGALAALIGLALAAALALTRPAVEPAWVRVIAGLVLAILLWSITGVGGPGLLLMAVLASGLSGALLASSLAVGDSARAANHAAWRTAVSVGIGSVLFVLLVFLYQIHITNPLPITNRVLPPLAAVILLVASVPAARAAVTIPIGWVAVPVALAVVAPLLLLVSQPAAGDEAGNGRSLRVLTWNIHSAVGADGMLDMAALAEVVRSQQADVVVMQEVTRGWLIAGTTDEAEWLARDLGMDFRWSQSADGQFGNLLLSRYPIVRSEAVPLPYVDGPQHRSYVEAEVDIGDNQLVTVIGAHLESNTERTLRTQIETLVAAADRHRPVIVAGDMNMQPTNSDLHLFTDGGLTSAQDVTGHGSESSALEPNFPGDRPDWIFGSSDVRFSDFRITHSDASDHLPLAVTATVR